MYVIEQGVELPPSKLAHSRAGPKTKRSALSIAMQSMEVGDSFQLETEQEYDSARARAWLFAPKKFATRKHGNGWRIWRTA
jgi:hypothetical protein